MEYTVVKNNQWDKNARSIKKSGARVYRKFEECLESIISDPQQEIKVLTGTINTHSVNFFGNNYRIAYSFYPCCPKPDYCITRNVDRTTCKGWIQLIKCGPRENFYEPSDTLFPD